MMRGISGQEINIKLLSFSFLPIGRTSYLSINLAYYPLLPKRKELSIDSHIFFLHHKDSSTRTSIDNRQSNSFEI